MQKFKQLLYLYHDFKTVYDIIYRYFIGKIYNTLYSRLK